MPQRRLHIQCNQQGQFFLLVEGDTVTIGDNPEGAPLVLQQLRVRRLHCELEVEGDPVALRSADSEQAGTPQAVRPGARLEAGRCQVQFEEDVAPVEPAVRPAVPAFTTAAPRTTWQGSLDRGLFVIDGGDQGQFFPLPAAGSVTLGKDRKHADLVLHDLYVARVHCRLEIVDNKVIVIDEGGLGTLLNGQKVTRQEMGPGDILRVGNSHLRLQPPGPGAGRAGGMESAAGALEEKAIGVRKDAGRATDEEDVAADDEEVSVEVIGSAEEETAPLPANASEAARVLQAWREKLPSLTSQVCGHYRLGVVLGRGRSGVVFRAEDQKTAQTVALKVLSPQFPHSDQELQRFAKVFKAVLPLRHPNLVALSAAGKAGAYTWIAQEHVEGESVARVLRRVGQKPKGDVRRACRIALHVGRALDFARQHHCRHGKITPANILVRGDDRSAKLADLVLGAALDGSLLGQAAQELRPPSELAYLSPEQADPEAFVDELSDLYGLGAVVYALLTGKPPFQGDTAEEILEQVRSLAAPTRPKALNTAVPSALEKIVLKLLAKHQEDRYQTPAELLADLERVAAKVGIEL